MLDTVKIRLNDYEVSKNNKLTVYPSPIQNGKKINNSKLFFYSKDEFEEGSKAIYNSDKINLTISPKDNNIHCFISFSVPKQLKSDNYNTLDIIETSIAFNQVENELKEAGIKTNVQESFLSRVDSVKNIITDEPFPVYKSVFETLSLPRMNKREYGEESYLYHNSQQEFCIYDKHEEMKIKGHDVVMVHKNSMRIEHRLLNSSKIKNVIGFKKVNDIINNFQDLEESYKDSLKKYIFNRDVDQINSLNSKHILTIDEIKPKLMRYVDKHKNWIERFSKDYGTLSLILQMGKEPYKQLIKSIIESEIGITKEAKQVKISRFNKNIEEVLQDFHFNSNIEITNSKTVSNLYNEIKTKILS